MIHYDTEGRELNYEDEPRTADGKTMAEEARDTTQMLGGVLLCLAVTGLLAAMLIVRWLWPS
jgi:hypothetical protein